METLALLEHLLKKYPSMGFFVNDRTSDDALTIEFSCLGTSISDPFVSLDGRREVEPSYYGLEFADAVLIKRHNSPQ